MAHAHLIVVKVVRRGDLDAAGAELGVDILIGDDRDCIALCGEDNADAGDYYGVLYF